MNWTTVNDKDESTLPPLGKIVFIVYLSDYDSGQVIQLGGRGDFGGEGWMWGRCDSDYFCRNWEPKLYAIEADEDYHVTHWAEIEWPEG